MTLFILQLRQGDGGSVVRARTTGEARLLAFNKDKNEAWLEPLFSTCQELKYDGPLGVIVQNVITI
jgi:hypothetical protein